MAAEMEIGKQVDSAKTAQQFLLSVMHPQSRANRGQAQGPR
jgi:hypothetical protein